MSFECVKRIRFSHCDPAGIVFYPRYAELFHEVVEDWFADGLEVDFRTLGAHYRRGVPAVRLEQEYLAPSCYGEVLTFRLEVVSVGKSSLRLRIGAHGTDSLRARADLTVVFTSMDDFRPVPFDDFWRDKFLPFHSGA